MHPFRLPIAVAIGILVSFGLETESSGSVVLWAWERPEDFRFLKAPYPGIAYWTGTFRIAARSSSRDLELSLHRRRQALEVPTGVHLMPVLRIEIPQALPADRLSGAAASRFAEAIWATVETESSEGLQIDFDARKSERSFYLHVLRRLKTLLGSRRRLSMTALASWCFDDRWLNGTPADEVVPMFFRMGADTSRIRSALESGVRIPEPLCRKATGLSIDETWKSPIAHTSNPTYIFNPQPWKSGDPIGDIR